MVVHRADIHLLSYEKTIHPAITLFYMSHFNLANFNSFSIMLSEEGPNFALCLEKKN